MPDVAQHELSLGDLPLVAADPTVKPYQIHALAEGTEFGNPEPVMVEIRSMLLDGSLARILNYDNRTIPVQVEITGVSLDDVAQGEADVMAEVRKGRNELRWLPPDSMAAATVFDVIWTRLDRSYGGWDMDERRFVRTFILTIAAAPFGRDDEETLVEAVGAGGTLPTPSTVAIDACDSATGWTATSNWPSAPLVGPTVVSGGVQVSTSGTGSKFSYTYTLTSPTYAASMATTPLLMVEVAHTFKNIDTLWIRFKVNGADITPVAQNGTVYYFDCSAIPTVTSLSVSHGLSSVRINGTLTHAASLRVVDVSRTNVNPVIGTSRQQFRAFPIGGSARTTGSLELAHETEALGEVLAYTANDDGSGNQPPCSQYRVNTLGAARTPDASTASGGRSLLNAATAETYDIPARTLPPGVYGVVARIKGSAPSIAGAYWRASSRVGTTNLGTKFADFNKGIIGVLPTWQLYDLGTATLPPVALPAGSDSFVRLDMRSSQAIEIDETWLFNLSTGAFSWVRCGTDTPSTGGSSSRLWIDTASLDWPRPAMWLGTEADRSDARHAMGSEVESLGTHALNPGVVNLFTYSNALNMAASARYHRRHQFHATRA